MKRETIIYNISKIQKLLESYIVSSVTSGGKCPVSRVLGTAYQFLFKIVTKCSNRKQCCVCVCVLDFIYIIYINTYKYI